MLRINDRIAIPLAEFRWEFSRSGGPGGQNVNKVNSKVVLRWNPAESRASPRPVRDRLLQAVATRLTQRGGTTRHIAADPRPGEEPGRLPGQGPRAGAGGGRAAQAAPSSRPTLASQIRRVESKTRRSATKRSPVP